MPASFAYIRRKSFSFLYRVTSESDSKFLEYLSVDLTEHDGRVDLASIEFRKLLKRSAAVFVMDAEH